MSGVVCAALAVLVYTFVGYPLLVAALARLRPLAVREDPGYLPTVTVCVPMYDAADHVEEKLESLADLDYPADRLTILLYSDGSTDGTEAVARAYAERDPRFRLIRGAERRGKPFALNRMMEAAEGEVLMMTDARQPLVPGALRALVQRLADPEVGAVSGTVHLFGSSGAALDWRYETWIREQEARFRGMVGVAGPLYALRRADAAPLPEDVILDDMWVPLRLRLQGRRIVLAEDAIAYDDAFDDGREYQRKVRTLAGNYQLFGLLPALLVPFLNPSWLEVFSHKILRLVSAWLIAILPFASAAALAGLGPSPAGIGALGLRALLSGQAAVFVLAMLGRRGGRAGTAARTFFVMNAAALAGLWRFVRGAQKVTW